MPKIDEVVSLVLHIGDKDFKSARKIVEDMIENERNNGRDMAYRKLRMALNSWGDGQKFIELPRKAEGLVFESSKQIDLSQIYLAEEIKDEVYKFINERKKLNQLRQAGLPLRNRILFAGPPGNGKTSLAGAIGKELGLPFYSVKISNVIESKLGSTVKNITSVLECAFDTNCVIFLDELDSVGTTRTAGADGCDREYNNTLNAILTNLDRMPDTSIVIGATNMPETLDDALLRRFNLKIWLGAPENDAIIKYVLSYQCDHEVNFFMSESDILNCLSGQPWSKVEEFCIDQHRAIVLGDYTRKSVSSQWIGNTM